MKRRAVDNDPTGVAILGTIFHPTEGENALWGKREEVAKFENSGTEPKDK